MISLPPPSSFDYQPIFFAPDKRAAATLRCHDADAAAAIARAPAAMFLRLLFHQRHGCCRRFSMMPY